MMSSCSQLTRNKIQHQAGRDNGDGEGVVDVPPFSMPFTAAPEMVLSIVFAASLIASTGLLRAMGVVLKRRAWRAIC